MKNKNPKIGTLRRRAKQRGMTLLEISLGVAISTVLLTAVATREVAQRLDDNVRAQAMAMKGPLLGALNQYLTERYSQLVQPNGGTIPGVANPLRPTIAELRALGMLKDPVMNTAYNGGNYRMVVTQYPTGCVATNCNLDALLYVDRPIVDWRNSIDYARLGIAMRTIGDDGAMSTAAAPGAFTGMSAKWSTVNPAGNVPGLLAARTGYNAAQFSQFYRRDGSLAMTNDVAVGGYSIQNANAVNAQKVNLPSGSSLQVGSTYLYGDSANMALRSPSGAVVVQNGSSGGYGGLYTGTATVYSNASVSGNVGVGGTMTATNTQANYAWANGSEVNYSNVYGDQTVYGNHAINGSLIARGMVYLPAMAWAGYGCGGNGITTDPNGEMLACKGGVWQMAGGSPSGTLCGSSQMGRSDWVGGHLCQGYDPWYSCPAGYSQVAIASIKGEQVNSCMKN